MKVIPSVIEKQIRSALSHYPTLNDTHIEFIFARGLKTSVMAARPKVNSLFRKRENRIYQILINPVFKLKHSFETIQRIPDGVMVGWIGHELGHILDYERRSIWGLIRFGLGYWLSRKYIRKAERIADSFAVNHGMGRYILETKSFILDHTGLPQAYKDKIASLYLSPDDIMELISELENEKDPQRSETLAKEEKVMQEVEAAFEVGNLPGERR